ncbi:hypothetical protein N7462_008521 [Penicillium macrosclerotiorum]|uniref:uncharacterized protein n=1 Tax=Penicillium macrosclerotiorum TaxID=303699 RepID=UPI002549AA3B|nr:uncharacterized protein N7462_008521 [Penicillium macrosclerotiorum]KAJ5675624.1 hypothetical protein N7462_008521 [Penicillium macrosclerotiorum]
MSVNIIKDASNAKVDIVLVHGLKHDDQENWTSAESSVFWPEKLLPSQVPDARIIAFEYDEANIDSFWNEEDLIADISDDLVNELMGERRGDKAERPLIFIAHCVGGLALIRACQHEKKKQLVNSVQGIILLGTPHFQPETLSEAGKYFQLAGKQIPSASDLEELSQFILKIPQNFAQLRQAAPIKVECFYEGAPMKLNDQEVKIVEVSVANMPGGSPATRLAGNHYQMSRFASDKDKDFKKVYRVLQEWVEDLPEPEKEGTVNNISNASFAGSTNSGYQLGQNVGNQTGFVFGR